MDNKHSGIFLFCMLTLFNCGAVLFLIGFFPDSYSTVENSDKSGYDRPTEVNGMSLTLPKRQYDQTILMIIDALRYDFMDMIDDLPYTHSKKCNHLKLRVAIPTVTMPRIKSLMTGKLSNFIDIIRNLGEPEQLTDSLVHILKKHGEMINFAGDRTWDQLFPTEFTRKEANLDSFFVNDFYEGDQQVKGTLSKEINETDWSLLILHFLGLDHIGHVEGSKSAKIGKKLLEMDNVIRDINENKFFSKRLLIVTGDHGMRNGGGHGGSTEEELNVPLVFFMKNCSEERYSKKVYNQIDLAATLAILFSVEIPEPSIGCLIPELLFNLSFEERLYAFYYNAQHLLNKAIKRYGEHDVQNTGYTQWYRKATQAHRHFLEAKMKNLVAGFHYEQALANYKRIAESISSRMVDALATFDYIAISIGIILTTTVTVYTMLFLLFAERKYVSKKKSSMLNKCQALVSFCLATLIIIGCQLIDLITISNWKSYVFIIFIAIAIYITFRILSVLVRVLLPLDYKTTFRSIWSFPIPLTLCYILTIVLLGSSSYVEFEEFSTHYLGVSCLMFFILRRLYHRLSDDFDFIVMSNVRFLNAIGNISRELMSYLVLLIALRLFSMREKSKIFEKNNWFKMLHEILLGMSFPIGLLMLIIQLRKLNSFRQMASAVLAIFCIFCFRAAQGQLNFVPVFKISSSIVLLLFWACVLATALLEFKLYLRHDGLLKFLQSFISCSLLIAALLHKPQNVILLPGMLIVLDKAYFFCDNLNLKIHDPYKQSHILASKTFFTIFIGSMFYFYQGNTNSLATIDLNPGYIGQSTYNPVIAVIFLTLNTYSSPIIAFYYLVHQILKNENSNASFVNGGIASAISSSIEALQHTLALYTTATLLPAAVYLAFMLLFRYHLFIYSVFSPKFFYECYDVIVYYINFCIFHIFLYLYK